MGPYIAAAAIAGGAMVLISLFTLTWYILQIIANWKIFRKAGEPGWKSIIPLYNYYIALKIVKMKNWFWWLIGIAVCAGIMIAVDGTNPFIMSETELEAYDWGSHPMVLFATLMMFFVSFYTYIVSAHRTSKVFGHGFGFTLGLIFLQPIFLMILGFGSSKYDKKRLSR